MSAILFDFNGTLFLDDEYHANAWQQIREKYNVNSQHNVIGTTNYQTIKAYLPDIDDKENHRISQEKEEIYRNIVLQENVELVKGATSFFAYLTQHQHPFTIASASIIENINFFIELFHLDDYFNPANIIYDDGTFIDKYQMYQQAAKTIQVPLSNCTIIEDSKHGLLSALQCNCHQVIAIKKASFKDFYDQHPSIIVVNNYIELLERIHNNEISLLP